MDLTKNFEQKAVEEKWSYHWKDKGYFKSTPDERKPFTIVIPPPNITGVLHMGHTLNETVQDILIRKARMSGFNACWVPGSDHASIATEAKVVQMLETEKGIKKSELSRYEFMKYAYEWKDKYGTIIYHQIEKLGCSVDWDRVTFTMDPHYYEAVMKVFVDLYNKGLIYRGARMINWDPAAKTALSDEEVEYKEIQGKLYYVKYRVAVDRWPLTDADNEQGTMNNNYIIIATQRPETIMGDTAVCVNPADERYRHLKGKYVIVPMVNRKVPIIFDEYVDTEFGTGALKVTPAHDIHDYNLALKYNLEVIDTLNEDGTLSEAAQVFVGLDRFEARKYAIEKLKKDGLLVKEEEYTTRLGFSQRTNAVVEPRISTQWFIKMAELAEPALKEVTEGRIQIHPGEKFLATYKYWLENVKDWCISRQLWWGHRIPAWYDEQGNVFVAEKEEEAIRQWSMVNGQSGDTPIHHSPFTIHQLKHDEDVLDTWFSSWLWPIEVFKGITNPGNEDIKYYYPTFVLVTGQDIIFFWVARMIMAGMEYMHEKPFDDVYFTGMVRDKQGRKMSKSLGNSPDLLELIDRFGADAVRFGIMISSPAGNDLLFDDSRCEQGKFFNNKLWNALKLVRSWESRVRSLSAAPRGELGVDENAKQQTPNFAIEWFEFRLNEIKSHVEELYKVFRLNEALKTIYSLIWDDFCSWYLEWVKPGFEQPVDVEVYNKTVLFFEQLIQLLHPFMPFVTEEIYHQLRERKEGDDLTIKQFELINKVVINKEQIELTEISKELIQKLREFRNKRKIKKDKTIHIIAYDFPYSTDDLNMRIGLTNAVCKTKITAIPPPNSELILVDVHKFYIDSGEFDKGFGEIIIRDRRNELLKDLEYYKGFLLSVEKKLSNERFVRNAKPEVVEIEQRKKADAEEKIKAIEESLASSANALS